MQSDGQKVEPLAAIMAQQPVIPVLKIARIKDAVPLARALAQGGLPAVEITLRTPVALDAIRAIAAEVPNAIVGAGTVLNAGQFEAAQSAGARFIVSPGFTGALAAAAATSQAPLLPGAITPGEIMQAAEAGYSLLKFFPAEQAGGAGFLQALASPFSGIRFCPTGGVDASNAPAYLGLANVACVGGSWVTPDALVAAGKWDEITTLAQQASLLRTN